MHPRAFDTHEDQLKESLAMHEAIVELVEGLTKLENGLCSNLKAMLDTGEEDGGDDGLGGLSDGFSLGDSDK
ncbi:hypothetical protein D3C73_1284130 [compost metagenome]